MGKAEDGEEFIRCPSSACEGPDLPVIKENVFGGDGPCISVLYADCPDYNVPGNSFFFF